MCYGTELTSNAILSWSDETGIGWHYIAPGKPQQNGFIESFMYGRPLRRKVDDEDPAACGSGAFMYAAYRCGLLMTAGPDGVRGSTPHQRVALEGA
jgi:putative transposase